MQAAAELDAFALNAGASRAPEELQGAQRAAQGGHAAALMLTLSPCAAIRAKAEEYRLRAQAIAPSVRRPRPVGVCPRQPRSLQCGACIAGASAGHGDDGAGGAGGRRAGVAGHAGGARCGRRADHGRSCNARRSRRRCRDGSANGKAPALAHANAFSARSRPESQAVVAGAGAAYATTRGDDVGDIARATGKQAVTMVEKAKGARCGLACCVPMLTHVWRRVRSHV